MNITLSKAHSFRQIGQRNNQEDSRFPDLDTCQSLSFVVCDGVGGNDDGEVASATVCSTMGRLLDNVDKSHPFVHEMMAEILMKTYKELQANRNSASMEMATTLTAVVFHAGGVTMSHIGDSRIYQFRKGKGICYRSHDHSLVQELISCGQITEEQARYHPQSNVITRSMNARAKDFCPATTLTTTDVMSGDVFFLCTDGVLSEITDNELTALLLSDAPDSEKMSSLADTCRASPDNNTATMVRVEKVVRDKISISYPTEPVDIIPELSSTMIEKTTIFLSKLFGHFSI